MVVEESGSTLPSEQPRCFFDMEIAGIPAGRIVFELFWDKTPKTAENFRGLVCGDKGIGKQTGKLLHYKNTIFHRIIKDFMVQGGDFVKGNGTGGESIYGGTFEDENFDLKHDEPFLLSMANRGPATNGSQFFILTQPAPHLNGIHVVFGRVVSGQEIVRQIENLPVDRKNRPLQDVKVANSGELVLMKRKKVKKEKKRKKTLEEKHSEDDGESSDGGQKKKKKKGKDKEHAKSPTSPVPVEEKKPLMENPFLPKVTEIEEGEIPKDPFNRLTRISQKDKEVEDDKDKDKDGKKKKKSKRSRSRSRGREERKRDRERRHEKELGERPDRGDRRGRSPPPPPMNRGRPEGFSRGNYERPPPFNRGSFNNGDKKVKGRGRIRYRPSRSRSRSRTPPHWKAEERKTISLKEFEQKEKARRERAEELRRRQEERERRHKESQEAAAEKRRHSQADSEGKPEESGTKHPSEIGEENSSAPAEEAADGVVYYHHLFKNKDGQDKSPSKTRQSEETSGGGTTLFPGVVKANTEEEQRLRNELLRKRLKAWEESSDEEGELKRSKDIASRIRLEAE